MYLFLNHKWASEGESTQNRGEESFSGKADLSPGDPLPESGWLWNRSNTYRQGQSHNRLKLITLGLGVAVQPLGGEWT